MSEEDKEKRKAERKLVSAYDAVPLSKEISEWLSGSEFRAFLDSWEDLLEVYIVYDTFTEFNMEVVSVYREITAYLRKIMTDASTEEDVREAASEALDEIEYWMDELKKEAERNLNNFGDMDGEV